MTTWIEKEPVRTTQGNLVWVQHSARTSRHFVRTLWDGIPDYPATDWEPCRTCQGDTVEGGW